MADEDKQRAIDSWNTRYENNNDQDLFYDLQDNICMKLNDNSYKILYDGDIFTIDNGYYIYRNKCFYTVWECDGDMKIEYDNEIHPRKMNIAEMEDLFDAELINSLKVE